MNRFILLLAAVILLATAGQTEAQLAGKLGKYLARKAIGESAEKAGKTAGSQVVAKAAKAIGKTAASQSTKKAGQAAVSKTSKALVQRFATKYGDDAAAALGKISSKSGRRLAMIESELAQSGQGKKLMSFIAKRSDGDLIVDFLYRNSGKIAVGGLIIKLISTPEEVMGAASDGVAKIVNATGESMVAPIAEKAARPLGHCLGFSIFAMSIIGFCGWLARRSRVSLETNAASV